MSHLRVQSTGDAGVDSLAHVIGYNLARKSGDSHTSRFALAERSPQVRLERSESGGRANYDEVLRRHKPRNPLEHPDRRNTELDVRSLGHRSLASQLRPCSIDD